jgi:hypothetical protein
MLKQITVAELIAELQACPPDAKVEFSAFYNDMPEDMGPVHGIERLYDINPDGSKGAIDNELVLIACTCV